ncbi:YiiX family permuted papain-like enzyme [Aureispira anguillae]|uniref:YiiX family permuted papain-like enzyme n=1 Tax=Aureispira anguillae TaxID=2864201 RepID=A0A916DXG9_9BACT|nr:YiiX family permuted papain-like enzyme [Aureispira anguillae]BDS15071.1 YiiX family permuted papain-like enzyme [Aureispira anguillae]
MIQSKMNLLVGCALFFIGGLLSCQTSTQEETTAHLTNEQLVVKHPVFKNGDIIFQTSNSSQSKAIQLATNSPYSHVGIIYQQNDEYWVYEAVEPVQLTQLATWVKRGKKGHYVVKRLKDTTILTPSVLNTMKSIGQRYNGKHYDLYFEWSDEKIYCSELVWKIYKEATGLSLGKLSRLSDFDLTHPTVQKKIQERFKRAIPLDEKVISPASIFNSDLLTTIYSQH